MAFITLKKSRAVRQESSTWNSICEEEKKEGKKKKPITLIADFEGFHVLILVYCNSKNLYDEITCLGAAPVCHYADELHGSLVCYVAAGYCVCVKDPRSLRILGPVQQKYSEKALRRQS